MINMKKLQVLEQTHHFPLTWALENFPFLGDLTHVDTVSESGVAVSLENNPQTRPFFGSMNIF